MPPWKKSEPVPAAGSTGVAGVLDDSPVSRLKVAPPSVDL